LRYTGDTAIIDELYPGIDRGLAWFARFVDADHLLNNLPHWLFVDWATVDKQGQCTAINAQYAHTLEMCAELADRVELPARAQAWRDQAAQVKAAINRHLWDAARGVYVDARVDGVQSRRVSQHANGICLAYGIVPEARQASVIRYITDPQRVKLTPTGSMLHVLDIPAFDEEQDVTLAQPFFMHHVHRGAIRAGQFPWVLDNIRQRWGAMLAAGSSTIWEHWTPLASQCHAWSTTPTYDLSTYLLGISPLADGFAKIGIAPQLGDLSWAAGHFPTPLGDIHVAWQRQDAQFDLTVETPTTSRVQVRLPVRAACVDVDGQTVWAAGGSRPELEGLSLHELAAGHLGLEFAQGGAHTIQVQTA
jgi:hypothetical protein